MSKQANPTAIGAFVVGAVLLIAVGAALFGGSELFRERLVYVAYFEEQTKGLRVGSNVVANGVRVGFVSDIALLVDEDTFTTMTMVTMDILPDAYVVIRRGERVQNTMDDAMSHGELIDDAGLRAQLEIESFITGQLLVRLDNRPDTEAVLRGYDPPHPEIPTIPSNIQEIVDKIQNWALSLRDNVDLGELAENLNDALRSFADLAGSEDLAETIAGLNEIVNRDDTQRLVYNLNETLKELRDAAAKASDLINNTDQKVDSVSNQLRPILARLDGTLEQVDIALAAANRQLRGDTEEVDQIQSTLKEVEQASRAIREFFDYMERNPEAFIKGKTQ